MLQNEIEDWNIKKWWEEIEQQYTHKRRHYHTLEHLESFYNELSKVKKEIQDWDCAVVALFYHDIIYKASSRNNEEESAIHAERRLRPLMWPAARLERCLSHIRATKLHSFEDDSDSNYFTDADLTILGYAPDEYQQYQQSIRKEFGIFPDIVYKPARKKFLISMLEKEKIYKTDYFYTQYEEQARINISFELSQYP